MHRIAITGYIGYERTARLLEQNREDLEQRFSRTFLTQCEQLAHRGTQQERFSEEYLLYTAPIGEGGLFGTLWQACEELEQRTGTVPVGCRVRIRDIPIRQEVIEILELFHENPYETPSPGARLLIWKDDLPDAIHDQMHRLAIIGYLTHDRKRLLLSDDTERFLTPKKRQRKDMEQRKQQKMTGAF